MTRTPLAVTLATTGCLVLAGCGASTSSGAASSAPPLTLTVFAAASLTKTFTALGQTFESEHPGTTVTFSFAGSSDLVTQLANGAPADVFASADTKNMDKAVAAGVVSGSPVDFATNTLEIATPPGNPATITAFADLARPGVRVVVCAPQVPCGNATQTVEKSAGVTLAPVSEESSVTDVLGKVESGAADAGVVYVTDVKGAGTKVTGVTFPESSAAVNVYPMATIKTTKNPDLAAQFTTLVTGTEGQQVLAAAGFAKP